MPDPEAPASAPGGLRLAGVADRDQLGATLAAAFADDPVFSWLIPPGAAARQRRLRALFSALASSYVAKEHCYLTEDAAAVALWAPPGRWVTPPSDIVRSARAMVGALRWGTIRSLRCLMTVEANHPKEPPHWYLGFLGTVPERQSQGLGSLLLQQVLQVADRDETAAYLESSNPRNIPLYRRHGFEVVEELSMPGGCPPVWRMWRPAGGQPTPG